MNCRGSKLRVYNCIVGGVDRSPFLCRLFWKGIMEKMEEGPLTGSYARWFAYVFTDGKMHPVDSMKFLSPVWQDVMPLAGGFPESQLKILEPIYDVEVLVPDEDMGDVMGDLQTRRAMIMGMDADSGFQKIKAKVPLKEMQRYSTCSEFHYRQDGPLSQMNFCRLWKVPSGSTEELLKAYQKTDIDE